MAKTSTIDIDQQKSAVPFGDESVARIVSGPFEAWLRCQAGILRAAQPATAGWIERRRAGATAMLDAIERLALCKDWEEAAAIHRRWIEDSMKRFDIELHAFSDHALAIAEETMSATRDAAHSSADVVALAIQPVQRAAATHPVDAAA